MMQLNDLVKRIKLPEEAVKAAMDYPVAQEEYETWKAYFYQDMKKFLDEWKKRPDKYQFAFVFYLRLALEVYDRYVECGIEDSIFDQTFYDITIWCRSCYQKHGVYGIEEAWWVGQSAKMRLFRLGRLQFEPYVVKETVANGETKLEEGEHVLNVHIPEGEPLKMEECLESFRMAEQFFDFSGELKHIYICDSWLLSPHLKELLPENSNIIRFQNLFKLVKVYYAYPQAEQRIFSEVREDKTQYPADTLLRRKAKEYLLEGKDLGIGVGVIDDVNRII